MAKSKVTRTLIEGLTRTNNAGKELRVFKVQGDGRGRPKIVVETSKGHYELLRLWDIKMRPKKKRGRPSKAEVAAREAQAAESGNGIPAETTENLGAEYEAPEAPLNDAERQAQADAQAED